MGDRISATIDMKAMPESASLMKFTELKTLKMVSLMRQKQKSLHRTPSTLPPVPRLCLLTRPSPITPSSVSMRNSSTATNVDSMRTSMPCSLSNVTNEISSRFSHRDHIPKSDPRTFLSKRVVTASNPTSRVQTNKIPRSSFSSGNARRKAEMFLRSLTPTQLANLRAAIIDRLKRKRTDLKEKNQLKVCNTSSNSSESTLSPSQSKQIISKDHTSRPIFATHFQTRSALKLPNDNSSNSIAQSMKEHQTRMQVESA